MLRQRKSLRIKYVSFLLWALPVLAFFQSKDGLAQSYTFEWAEHLSSVNSVDVGGCAYDPFGNIYCTGRFWSTMDIDTLHFQSQDRTDLFLAKYDSLGNVQWAIQSITDTLGALGKDVATDALGNVYLGATIYADVTIGNQLIPKSSGYMDMLLLKFDTNGNLLWYRKSSGYGSYVQNIDVDASGNVIVACEIFGFIICEQDTIVPNGDCVAFIKYDSNGNLLWHAKIEATQVMRCYEIVTDDLDNIYAVGQAQGITNFGNEFQFPVSGLWVYMTKLNSNGSFAWAKKETAGGTWDFAVSIDYWKGSLYVSGQLEQTSMSYGGYTIPPFPNDMNRGKHLIMKFDTSGTMQWLRFNYAGGAGGGRIKVSPTGIITVIGGLNGGTLHIGDTSFVDNGGGYWAQYNQNGDYLYSQQYNVRFGGAIELDTYKDKLGFYGSFVDTIRFATDTFIQPYIIYSGVERNGFLYQIKDTALYKPEPPQPANWEYTLFPNPTQDNIYINLFSEGDDEIEIQLWDIRGRKLQSLKYNVTAGNQQLTFPMDTYAVGNYVMQVIKPSGTAVHKIVKFQR